MRRSVVLFALFAVLAVVVSSLPATVTVPTGHEPPPAAVPAPAVTVALARDAGNVSAKAWQALASLPDPVLSSVLHRAGYAPWITPTEFRTFVNVTTFGPDYLKGALTGCVIAGSAGALVGGPLGAGVGCAAGAAAVDLALYFFGGTAQNAATLVEKQFNDDMAVQFGNDGVYSDGFVQGTASVLNSTYNAWAAMSSSVATAQLGNATFDGLRDLNDSSVPLQLATLEDNYVAAIGAGFHAIGQSYLQAYGSGGPFAGTCHYALTANLASGTLLLGCGASTYANSGAVLQNGLQNGEGVYFQPNASVVFYCSADSYFNSVPSGSQIHVSATTETRHTFGSTEGTMWRLNAGVGGNCQTTGTGFIGIPYGGVSSQTAVYLAGCGSGSSSGCSLNNATAILGGVATVSNIHSYLLPSTTSATAAAFGGPYGEFYLEMNAILQNAAVAAQTYYTFLRNLGYTSASQIPSNCIIPYPDQILPPQYDAGLGTLTLNQSLSLYQAWMNGLATFFDTPVNASFCGGHPQFQVGAVPWAINTEVTGWVFTVPVGGQVLSNRSTWTVGNGSGTTNQTGNASHKGLRSDPTTLILWPLATSLNAKIGAVQEVPVNDPLSAFVPNNGTLYTLYGNGTATNAAGFSNGSAAGSGAGAALYIATCKVRGSDGNYTNAPSNVCPLTLSTIQTVSFTQNVGPTPDIGTVGVCADGSLGILTPLASLIGGVFAIFGSGIACLIGEVIAVIVLVVAVVLVLWVAVKIYGAVRD